MTIKFIHISLILICIFQIKGLAQDAKVAPLASGEVYKLAVSSNDIYKIDYKFLTASGIDPAIINPKSLKIYGQPGGMLPQKNAEGIASLQEFAIFVAGEDDGVFDSEDYILFYGEGADKYYYDSTLQVFRVEKNLYAQKNHYYLTYGGENGKRIQQQKVADQNVPEITWFDNFQHHELDQVNLLNSGRHWLGESFGDQTTQTIELPAANILADTEVKLLASVASLAHSEAIFQFSLNAQSLGSITTPPLASGIYGDKAAIEEKLFTTTATNINEQWRITIDFILPDRHDYGYLDYLTLNYQQKLNYSGPSLLFRSLHSTQNFFSKYKISATQEINVWDVSQPVSPVAIALTVNANGIEFVAFSAFLKDYVAFAHNNASAPEFSGRVKNQDLTHITVPDFLIVSPSEFLGEAKRLAIHRQTNDNLSTAVVTPEQIYNEFSAGKQDVTAIRNFIRRLYLVEPEKLKYVLLFGDASFDYLKSTGDGNSNYVPTYQSRNSTHNIFSHASDDYFGFMDKDEGTWPESNQNQDNIHDLEIGIGRLPITSSKEAKFVVEKLIRYDQKISLGPWRSKMAFVADDGDQNKHQLRSDFLADYVEQNLPSIIPEKVFIDAYPQTEVAGSSVALAARRRLDQLVAEGTLIIDYIGHGGETAWASESLLVLNNIFNWRNFDNLPLFITATCEFGRFDDYQRQSGAELAILQPAGGAIGLFTTTRPVFANTNFDLSFAFYKILTEKKYRRLGDLFRATKNASIQGIINRNFTLLGDPSQALALPHQQAVITTINQQNVTLLDSLSAYSEITINGQIEENEQINADFNGNIHITIYDEPATKITLGDGNNQPMSFKSWENVLFKGLANVEKGKFIYQLTLPNLNEFNQPGKITMYASGLSQKQDANGFLKFTNKQPCETCTDDTPPEIKFYIDNENFRTGQEVSAHPVLFLNLKDDSGLNIAYIENHNIVVIIDDVDTLILNQYYQPVVDSANQGKIIFELPELTRGKHKLKIAASDLFLNRIVAETSFVIGEKAEDNINSFLVAPNPASEYTKFHFELDEADFIMNAKVLIFSSKGQLMKELQSEIDGIGKQEFSLMLDLNQVNGSPLFSGIYIFHFFLHDASGNLLGKRRGQMAIKK